jgi:hypothetical protein
VFEDIRVLIEFYIWSKNNMNLHDLGEIVGEETIECRNLLKETGMIFKISSVKSLNFFREIKNRVSTRFFILSISRINASWPGNGQHG